MSTLRVFLISFLFHYAFSAQLAFAQTLTPSNIQLRISESVDNEDQANLMRFQDIKFANVKFNGLHLIDKNFKISIRDFANGKLVKTYEVFDSREDDYFKIKKEQFRFSVLVQGTLQNKVKFAFYFDGFSIDKEYDIEADQKDFALKSFQGRKEYVDIALNTNNTILTFMQPFKAADGSTKYCDVVQSDVKPEGLGQKFAIPRYFLVDIRFE
jgi:hypothetical protein